MRMYMRISEINNELSLELPEGFRAMTLEEVKAASISAPDDGFTAKDEARRMIVSVHWKKLPFLLGAFADPKENMKSTEQMIRSGLKDNAYELLSTGTYTAGSENVPGFAYEYTVKEVRQYSEAVFLKHNNMIYALYCYGVGERKDEVHAVFASVLKSVQFAS